MSKQVGPLQVCCDAPTYEIVRACHEIGIESPEDVRWLRMSSFKYRYPTRPTGLSTFLRELLNGIGRQSTKCTCGAALPGLELVVIACEDGEDSAYHLGQCGKCRTVFWDEV